MAKNNNKNLARQNLASQNSSGQVERPPVVVIMGHVDHGKTSLLDYIRKTKVASREAGGITQHVSAYEITVNSNPASLESIKGQRKITFIDTPGHEAFTKIRERGTRVADIAVLVIASEEGLKPQTKEVLNFIKEAKIPYIIALNKSDLPQANQDKVKQQLAELEIYVEDWGGKIPCLNISAKTGAGINELLEMIVLMAEMEELKADPSSEPEGIIIESSLDPQKGIFATGIILNGTLALGQTIYTKTAEVKIKSLESFSKERVKSLSFSSPAIIIGWNQPPEAGETFSTKKPEREIKIESELNRKAAGKEKTFSLILKADAAGSVEALEAVILPIFKEVELTPVVEDKSAGPISLTDIKTAENTNAAIISFRSKITNEVGNYIRDRKIKIFESEIIYELQENLKKYLEELIKPDEEKLTGKLEILEIFSEKDKKNKQVVGGRLFEGKARKGQRINIKRTEELVGQAKILSIKKGKQEMESSEAVNEIGLQIETSADISKGDIFEFRV